MMTYNNLSWRRMIKCGKTVNLSFEAKNCIDVLFKKYPRSSSLIENNITLKEYDTHLQLAWISVWKNMLDSGSRFNYSQQYNDWLSLPKKVSIRDVINV